MSAPNVFQNYIFTKFHHSNELFRYNSKKGELVQINPGMKATFKIPSNTIAGKLWNKSLRQKKPKSHRKMSSVKKIAFKVYQRAALTMTRLTFWIIRSSYNVILQQISAIKSCTLLIILYFAIWIESKPIVWDSSCSIIDNFD